MPQLTRLFIPNQSTFPENITTISLGVDDLVKVLLQLRLRQYGKQRRPEHQNAAQCSVQHDGVASA